jgi:multiple sugar transport system substrate-binding protein
MHRTQLSRRRLLGAAGALAGAAALPNVGRVAKADDTITLNVFVHDNHPFDKVKPIYEAKYPNVKLNMMKQNDVAVFRATLAAKGDGTPDILWPEIDMVQELGKTGVLLDVTDIVTAAKADLAPGKTAECFIPSTQKYAAFPGDIATVGLFYRQDLLDKAGVTIPDDWTWDEFAEAAKEIKSKTGANSLVIPTTGTADTAILWSFILNQMGGAITNADGTQVTLDDDKGIAAMEQTKRLFAADVAVDEVATMENYFAEIAAGNVAITPQAVWYRGFGIEPYATDETSGLGQWRVALLPNAGPNTARTANYGGAAIASTIYTKHPQEVKNFMTLALGTEEGAKACGDWGILPPYLPYLKSTDWSAARSPAFGDFAFNDVWTQAVDHYEATWYKQPVFTEAMTAVGAAMMPMLQGSVEVAAGLKAVGDQVRQLNTRYQ